MSKATRKTRVVALLLAAVMLVMSANVLPAFAAGEYGVVEIPHDYAARSSFQTLEKSANLTALKKTLTEGLDRCDTSIDISSFRLAPTEENTQALADLIFNEMPLVFHISGYTYYRGDVISRIEPHYKYSYNMYWQMRGEVDAAANKLLDGIRGNNKLGEVEKALLIHDRLALICEYDYTNSFTQGDIYGALVEGSAVCQGYAEAYDYLMEQVGIESYLCTSDRLNHAWNIIKVNGKYYHVDVTWDDYAWQSGKRGAIGYVIHDNFLRSSNGIYSEGHMATDYDTYPTDTTYDNYFWQSSDAAFQLVGDEIYYIDNETAQLKRYSDRSALCNVADNWRSSHGLWRNFARLSTDGVSLFFSQAKGVYKYDLSTGRTSLIYKPTLAAYFNIYGLDYVDGHLICDINDTPPFSPYGIAGLYQERVFFDEIPPVAGISATNNVAAQQQVTLQISDNVEAEGYYWGTSSTYSSNPYTFASGSVTKTVTEPGTYYLTVQDSAGNHSETKSITFYKTTLNANGGSVSPAAVLTAAGKSFVFPQPARSNYKFKGWATSADAAAGILSLAPTADRTYYAVWEACNHEDTVIRYLAATAAKAGEWQNYCQSCRQVLGSKPIDKGHPFNDVKDSSVWFYPYAMYGKAYKLFKNAAFNGSANITRAEFVTTLCRTGLSGFLTEEQILAKYAKKSSVKQDFADMKDSDWFAPYARYMKDLGVVGGDNKGNFNGSANITREEVAAMMHRLVKLVDPGEKLVFIEKPVDKFADAGAVASWFKADVEWARKSGLFAGNAQKQMEPKKNNSRTEMAVVLQRFTVSYWGIVII